MLASASKTSQKEELVIHEKRVDGSVIEFTRSLSPIDSPSDQSQLPHSDEKDSEFVRFSESDKENPKSWSKYKKAATVLMASGYTLISPMSSSILSPAMKNLASDLDITSTTVQSLVVSIHILAWAVGPLIMAPLSEIDRIGRRRVLNYSSWLSLIFNLACALSKNTAQIVVFRFISGLFSGTALNISPAVVSDLYDSKSRNVSLAAVFLVPFVGPAVAPIVGGYIVMAKDWRWVLYFLSMLNGCIAVIGMIFFPETHAPTILHNRAKKLRKETGNPAYHTAHELTGEESIVGKLKRTITRPIVLLFTNVVIIGLGGFMAFIYGFLYLMIVVFPGIYEEIYGMSTEHASLMYLSLGIGFIVGVFVWTVLTNKVYNHLTAKNLGVAEPEFRLPCLFVASLLIPAGLLWFGWSVEKRLNHWISAVGSGVFAFALVCVFQSLQAYLIDMNPAQAASYIAAAAVFRFIFGFLFPLFAHQMFAALGYGWGNTLCASLAFVLGFPFPIICYKYGKYFREISGDSE